MSEYTDEQKEKDFAFFKTINNSFYSKNGHSYIAIKNEKIIDYANSVNTLIQKMNEKSYSVGSYIIQECTGDESAYTNVVMRLLIKG
jgi:hypothetical protein